MEEKKQEVIKKYTEGDVHSSVLKEDGELRIKFTKWEGEAKKTFKYEDLESLKKLCDHLLKEKEDIKEE